MWLQGAYEQKLLNYSILVTVSAMRAQMQVAYGYMGCSGMHNLGNNFLVA
jgi:hypothetical protein